MLFRSLIFVLVALLVSACGGSGGSSDASNSSGGSNSSGSSEDSGSSGDNGSSDDSGSANDIVITVDQADQIETAMASGDMSDLPSDIGISYQAIIDRAEDFKQRYQAQLASIYGSSSVDYPVTRRSQFVGIQSSVASTIMPLVIGNGGAVHAAFGELDGQKTAAFGTNIFVSARSGDELAAYSDHLVSLVHWMTGVDLSDANAALTVKVANVSSNSSTSTYTNIVSWFDQQSASSSVSRCFGQTAVESCMDTPPDLFIVSSDANAPAQAQALIDTALVEAKAAGVPVIYTHTDIEYTTAYTNAILSPLGYYMEEDPNIHGNYFVSDADRHASWSNEDEMYAAVARSHFYLAADALATRLRDNSFTYDLPNCAEDDCNNDTRFADELGAGLATLRDQFTLFDEGNFNIFDHDGVYEIEKLVALVGDRLRSQIALPMDKTTADRLDWSEALFADYTVYNSRDFNPVQTDLGNFSRSDFSHVTPTNKSLSFTSKPDFRAAGVYVLPGKTVTVTRTDANSSLVTEVYVNAQRPGSSKPFTLLSDSSSGRTGFVRPQFLRSPSMPIAPGQTLTFTSPYGGPLYITFDDVGITASFDVTNIGLHPFWDGVEDNAFFAQGMTDKDYDWAEVVSEHVEVHSRVTLMETTFTELDGQGIPDTAEEVSRLMQKYTHGDLFALAGFTGPGIQTTTEAENLITGMGLSFTPRDKVQHGIMDQPLCGYGCSGNPYDTAWDFHPLGHGDLHEIGHTIEEAKFKFDGREGHATTNPYSYYSKHRAWLEEGIEPDCQNVRFDEIKAFLDTAQGEADADAYMAAQDLNGWNHGIALMIQVLMSAQHVSALTDGWQLYPALHVLEREFSDIDGNDTDWNAGRAAIGFGSFTRAEATSISNNDFLLVSMSHILGYDLTDYLEMFGLSFGATAKAQVAGFGHPVMPRNFFLPANNPDFCKTLTQPVVAY